MIKKVSMPPGHDTLPRILFAEGFGTRRECEALVMAGCVTVDGQVCDDPQTAFPRDRLVLTVRDQPWETRALALLMLHKPAGYECSLRPSAWPGVHMLLPPPLRARGLQPVGRLDQDTTGLLLFTDDGRLLHKLTSPQHHVPKVYEVICKHEVTRAQIEQLLAGVVLDDDPLPVAAHAVEWPGAAASTHVRLTLLQGKYHQVKRMLAAVGNRVEALHRSQIGRLQLPADLRPGQWRWLDGADLVLPGPAAP